MTATTYILFSNLKTVTINEVSASVSVLALIERARIHAISRLPVWDRSAHAFGVDAAWHVFTMPIPTLDHELLVRELDDPFGHDAVQIAGGPCFFFAKDTWDEPVNVTRIEFDEDDKQQRDRGQLRVRATITRFAAHYWRAPYMPGLVWGPRKEMEQYNLRSAER